MPEAHPAPGDALSRPRRPSAAAADPPQSIAALAGRAYGPATFPVAEAAVADFVGATGDDPRRWRGNAPPPFAAAALFAVAPALLGELAQAEPACALLHTEQAFTWHRPLAVGEVVFVRGEVEGVRTRGARHLLVLGVSATGREGLWMEGRSSFLLSAEPAGAGTGAEDVEPEYDRRGACDPAAPADLPAPGAALAVLRRSASRADLVRYAAATRDWNPIHWDHAAAHAAGLPGVVAHGLLVASWLGQAAARYRAGPDPLRQARVRFHRPLRPGAEALLTGRVSAVGDQGADLELALESGTGGPALARAAVRVTP